MTWGKFWHNNKKKIVGIYTLTHKKVVSYLILKNKYNILIG